MALESWEHSSTRGSSDRHIHTIRCPRRYLVHVCREKVCIAPCISMYRGYPCAFSFLLPSESQRHLSRREKGRLAQMLWHPTLHVNAALQQWMQVRWLNIDFGLKLLAKKRDPRRSRMNTLSALVWSPTNTLAAYSRNGGPWDVKVLRNSASPASINAHPAPGISCRRKGNHSGCRFSWRRCSALRISVR